MSGEAPRTLSAVRHQMKGPALACEGSSAPYGTLLLGTGPDMDALLSVCTAHSTTSVMSTCIRLIMIPVWDRGGLAESGVLRKQCRHVDKGRG